MSYLANGKELTTTEDAILESIAALTTPLYYLRINAGGTGVEWAAVATAGATAALDNLASVAINTTLVSDTDNTDALGTLSIAWSDLFLGNGAVINFTSSAGVSDVTITHSSNALTIVGGDLIMATSLGATGTRVLKGWFTDLESTNMPTVGGTAILTSLTAPQFTTIELGHATDTTLSRASAGNLAIEGNLVYRAGGTDVPVTDGGTGLSAISALSILVANSANTFVEVTPGAGNSIRVNAGGTAWEAFTPSASVPTTITVANEATDTTCFPLFATAATGDLGPKTVASFTLNSNTGALGITSIELGHASDTSITRASAGVIAVEGKNVYMAGGTDVALADGGTGASLTDPNADRIMFWDDSAGAVDWLTASTGLAITTTSIAVDQTTAFAWTGAHTWSKAGVLNTLTNTTNSASVQIMILQGDRATMAANDEAYVTLSLSDSAGNQDEQARITWKATTVTSGATQDGQLIFSTLLNNVLTTALTIGGASIDATFAGNLSIGTSNAFTTGTIELGHASDTTLSRVSAGVVAIEGVNILTTATGLALSGGTMTGNITLGENTSIALDPAGSADGKYTGITISGTAGAALAFGEVCYLSSVDSRWELADADAASTADRMLGICVLAAAADGNATVMLLVGQIRADAKFPALTIGSPVYLGETAGAVQTAIPTGADNVIRRVGYALTADELYFNPSMDSQTTVA